MGHDGLHLLVLELQSAGIEDLDVNPVGLIPEGVPARANDVGQPTVLPDQSALVVGQVAD
jgi:hypothetical protein